ncbi:calmodulin-binding protein 25-like [Silene latifolia]|uniref:calmodulin-binding protein 25-like n=1 Tax=Silene latifolia TaxID=37657 RepID=UPI003D77AB89
MTSFENIGSSETWAFRPSFETSWFSDDFDRDTELFTKALTQSITHGSSHKDVSTFSETPSSLPVHSVSTSGGSEPETPSVSKRPPRNPLSVKSAKRKSRASKRSPTTFITADPANFRAMVQQVTGVRFNSGSGPILKPEPHRAGLGSGVVNRLQGGGGGYLLPTLDTSAFLLGHHQQIVGPSSGGGVAQGFGGPNPGEVGGSGFDFDGFSCFPTLESGKVM